MNDSGTISLTRWFSDRDVDLEATVENGRTPLTIVAVAGGARMVLFLLDMREGPTRPAGANPRQPSDSGPVRHLFQRLRSIAPSPGASWHPAPETATLY